MPINPVIQCNQAVIVLCTTRDKTSAQNLAKLALDKKLAACVSIIPNVTSIYYWQDKLVEDDEVQMLFKTTLKQYDMLLTLLKENHPYQVPELLVLPVTAGEKNYLSWLTTSLD